MTKRPKEEEKIKMNIATTVHFPHSYMQGLKKGSGWYNSHRSWILGPKKDWKLTQRMATVDSHGKTFNEWRLPAHTESIHSIRPWANKCHITLSFFHATFVFFRSFFRFFRCKFSCSLLVNVMPLNLSFERIAHTTDSKRNDMK